MAIDQEPSPFKPRNTYNPSYRHTFVARKNWEEDRKSAGMSEAPKLVAVSTKHAPTDDSVEMFRDSSALWMVVGLERPRIKAMVSEMLQHGEVGEFLVRSFTGAGENEFKIAIMVSKGKSVTYLIEPSTDGEVPGFVVRGATAVLPSLPALVAFYAEEARVALGELQLIVPRHVEYAPWKAHAEGEYVRAIQAVVNYFGPNRRASSIHRAGHKVGTHVLSQVKKQKADGDEGGGADGAIAE
eukprot:gene209-28285_t